MFWSFLWISYLSLVVPYSWRSDTSGDLLDLLKPAASKNPFGSRFFGAAKSPKGRWKTSARSLCHRNLSTHNLLDICSHPQLQWSFERPDELDWFSWCMMKYIYFIVLPSSKHSLNTKKQNTHTKQNNVHSVFLLHKKMQHKDQLFGGSWSFCWCHSIALRENLP